MDQLVQNVPDLGHIHILHTDQKHCNVLLDMNMPDIGHISKCVRSLFYAVRQKCAQFRSNSLNEIQNLTYYEQNKREQIVLRLVYSFDVSLLLFPVRNVIRVPKPRARRL